MDYKDEGKKTPKPTTINTASQQRNYIPTILK